MEDIMDNKKVQGKGHSQLFACLKNEWIRFVRTKKVLAFSLISIGLMLISLLLVVAIDSFAKSGTIPEGMNGEMLNAIKMSDFAISAFNSVGSDYSFIVIFFLMGSISTEYKNKKWILPATSGINPKNIIISKYIVLGSATLLCYLVGWVLNLSLSLLIFGPGYLSFWEIALSMLSTLVYILFYAVLTISLSAMTKNTAVAALVPLALCLIVFPIISLYPCHKWFPILPFISYSANIVSTLSVGQWILSGGLTLLIMGVLIFFSIYINSKKMKYLM